MDASTNNTISNCDSMYVCVCVNLRCEESETTKLDLTYTILE